jgi:hypothetical protein
MKGEVNVGMKRLFEPLDVTFRDAGDLPWNHDGVVKRNAHGFKPYSLIHSRFREILFIDADNAVFRNPEFLFESAEFTANRAIFWPDRWKETQMLGISELRRDFGVDAEADTEFETGQIVVDKEACWQALNLTLHLNRNNTYYYRYLYGDKETFRLAFDFHRTPYALISKPPSKRETLIGAELTQFGADEQPLFLHRIGPGKFHFCRPIRAYHQVPNLPEAHVEEVLKTLRGRLGEVFPARERALQFVRGWYWARRRSARQLVEQTAFGRSLVQRRRRRAF